MTIESTEPTRHALVDISDQYVLLVAYTDLAFDIHQQMGSVLGGVHFELTGENVTECIGGSSGLTAEDLKRAYKSPVDPRLNYEQSLEMALLIGRRLRMQRDR